MDLHPANFRIDTEFHGRPHPERWHVLINIGGYSDTQIRELMAKRTGVLVKAEEATQLWERRDAVTLALERAIVGCRPSLILHEVLPKLVHALGSRFPLVEVMWADREVKFCESMLPQAAPNFLPFKVLQGRLSRARDKLKNLRAQSR